MLVFMQLTEAQFERIADLLPRQRGNVRLSNLQVINAILYVATNGCKWHALPEKYGKWNTATSLSSLSRKSYDSVNTA